ncbi:MAG: alpha-1,2-fucosyltransferase [Patescibacteria group bacterium]|nr:alpha-1,2-fucosyltransferase [Patescibacteria group bacterium]MDE2021760.1 alpha-1,2-fucosyltransferase [Patescibacteria group bacterium]
MIIARIQGGLGNQLFQYACGLSIARAKGVPFKLDLSSFDEVQKGDPRPYQLTQFSITAPRTTPFDFLRAGIPSLRRNLLATLLRKAFRLFDDRRPLEKRALIFEPRPSFLPELFSVRDNCVLIGNWQSEKYFTAIADTVRKEFILKDGFGAEAEAFARMIADETRGVPVSLHVRRGDKADVPRLVNFHGSLDISYYRDAAARMKEKVGAVVFYIFSDDIPWVKKHLLSGLGPAVIVSAPGISDAEDITLMSRCRHHIVAHSSFSWWGAWLNPRSDKVVIGPKRWYKQEVDTSDLMPSSWIQIENELR